VHQQPEKDPALETSIHSSPVGLTLTYTHPQLVHEDSVIAATQPTGIIELRAESSEEKAGWLAAFQPVAASSK
jgi:hypothetical protein